MPHSFFTRQIRRTTLAVLIVGSCCSAAWAERGEAWWWDVAPGQPGMNDQVHSLYVLEDMTTNTSKLLVGGSFTTAGSLPAHRIAQWTGSDWVAFGDSISLSNVSNMTVFDAGEGPQLFAIGAPDGNGTSLARWSNKAWSAVAGAPASWMGGIGVFETDGVNELYISGGFIHETPEGTAVYVARWNGDQWRPAGNPGSAVHDMLVWNDGSGESLFATGSLVFDGKVTLCGGIGRWDGSLWNTVGTCDFVLGNAMAIHHNGGEALYLGGWFTQINGIATSNIARWDGSTWSALGSGVNGQVHAVAVFDDGCGPALFVAGEFTMAGGSPANNIARWDGASWSPVGEGANGPIFALETIDADAGGPALVVGGDFTMIDGEAANRIAFLRRPQTPVPSDLNADGAVDVADLLILLAAWGPCPNGQPCQADLTGDGVVDVADLLLILANWG